MNMLTFDKTEIQKQTKPFIAEAVFAVETISSNRQSEKQIKAKQLLDRLFPLENGSHQDVTSYVIDYRHVLAFFKNGQHSGLQHPKQFVAYMGEKCDPDSILLRDGSGSHLEVMFGSHKGTGCVELVDIDDIQLETCTTFSQAPKDMTSDRSAMDESTAAMRHWISLVKGDEKGKPKACSEDKEFKAKSGEDYRLDYCYHL
ncbi:hypothetical protein L4C37_04420 [Vibrio kagoshimensis]|uniref:hypothetical protein n=1 Tax=Vibrio kagoshimensis TaxID=2910244 RepID=UPI0023551B51